MLSYRCSSIKDSVWLCTLRNNELYCDSESPCLGSALLHGFFFLIWSFFWILKNSLHAWVFEP